MHLEHLHLLNFKNYEELKLDFSSEINCFLGNNGSGKTNLLDAIFYLAFCKSFFNPIDSQLIKENENFFMLQGDFLRKEEKENVYCGLKKGQKKQFKRNKKEYEKLANHIGLIPLVMISPSDSELILGGSDVRRRFLDIVISQYDRSYLDHLMLYNKALSQRNRLLKKFMEIRKFDEASLEVWDEQLVKYGQPIFEARKDFIEKFQSLFQKNYDFISDKREEVRLDYESSLLTESFGAALIHARDRDKRMTYSTAGVHKDDLIFRINGHPMKKFGSQGQQKTFLLALKLSQAELLKEVKQIAPILLLDDIYDKLDQERVEKLMTIVRKDWFGQVFISDTHKDRLPDLFKELKAEFCAFHIEKGKLLNEK